MKKINIVLCLILSLCLSLPSFGIVSVYSAEETTKESRLFFVDDIEGLDAGTELKWSREACDYNYHTFGNYSKNAVVSDDVAYSGKNSIKVYNRCDSNVSLKLINLFEVNENDIGKTINISFKIYADKSAGVYKNSGKSLDECVPLTEEELANSHGTVFRVMTAGPDGTNYTHRSGTSADNFKFVKWNEWTQMSIQYTVSAKYLDNGSEEAGANPYINAVKIHQRLWDYAPNDALCDTFYVDDICISEVKAHVEASSVSPDGNELNISTFFYKPESKITANTIVCEYLGNQLVNVKVGDKSSVTYSPTTNYPINKTMNFTKKYKESVIKAFVLSNDKATPLCPVTDLSYVSWDVKESVMDSLSDYADSIIAESTATYEDNIKETPLVDGNKYYRSVAAAYTQSASPNETRFNDTLVARKTCDSYIRFDVPDKTDKVAYAYLRLYTAGIENTDGGTVSVYATGNDWDETNLTHNNAPKLEEKIGELEVTDPNVPYYFDITDYINKTLPENKTSYSFVLSADGSTIVYFYPERRSMKYYHPSLIFEGVGKTKEELPLSAFSGDSFVDVLHTTDEANHDPDDKESVRVLSSLTDFTPSTSMPDLTKYGGWIDGGKYTATGFFRTEFIDGRWWFIDPLGYKYINMGVAETHPKKNTEIQAKGFEERYGTDENWAKQIAEEFRSYGYNAVGPFSDYKISLNTETPLTQTVFKGSFLQGFDNGGWQSKGLLEVFSPRFEEHCLAQAEKLCKDYADNPYIVGWYTDNEPPASDSMLKNALLRDVEYMDNFYDLAVAWKWLRLRHGEDATVDDITEKDQMDWVEFCYDRYMKVVTESIRTYDKNHLIFGPKLDKNNRGMFRAVGRYADALGYDYYPNAFTPDRMVVNEWYKWGGKPLMNAEWYAKGHDAITEESDLTNIAGVGYEVSTQRDRGYYYQAFALSMLDSNVFIGWQWFKYLDNDPSDLTQDYSNLNANKGIFTRDYKTWDTILSMMKEFNINVYNIAEYLDK